MFRTTSCFISFVGLLGLSIEQLVIGGFVANWLCHEPRAFKQIVKDLHTTRRISHRLSQAISEEEASIRPVSYNKHVLLLGQVTSPALKEKAYECAREESGTQQILNQLTIEPPKGAWQHIHDKYLTYKIRAKILLLPGIRYHQLQVATENKEVFLIGQATPAQTEKVRNMIQNTNGVTQLKQLIYPEE